MSQIFQIETILKSSINLIKLLREDFECITYMEI